MAKRHRRKKGKVGRVILGIIGALLLVLVIFVAVNASRNVKAMNRSIDAVLEELNKTYTVTQISPGDYEQMKMYGIMKFKVEQYAIEGLGNLSVMRVNMGVMQMATIVITPKEKNMPLLSADYMYILSNRKSYLEFYDVVQEKDAVYMQLIAKLSDVIDKYSHLEDFEASEAWYEHLLSVDAYKAGKPKNDADVEQMLRESVRVYLNHAKALPELTDEQKTEKKNITLAYTDGLIEKGGISTDVFKKELGPEVTKDFFDQVFFGTLR
ncbi:MAG: hypothetical protein J6J38_03620 [Lachnospiraceae bacterium]|nr:hypothetical protein [Lachnospiraceae bacterium]